MISDAYNFTHETMFLKQGRYSGQSNLISLRYSHRTWGEKTSRVKITRNSLKNDSTDTCRLQSEINISALGKLMITIIQIDRTSVSLQCCKLIGGNIMH